MKKVFLFPILILSLASCSKESLRGSGDTITETRTIGSFTDVELSGSGDMEVIPSNERRVEITGYRNLVSEYETEVKGGTLKCGFDNDVMNVRNNNIRVRLYTPDLGGVTLNGSGEISVLSNGDLGLVDATINGSGEITVSQPEAANRDFEINGSGKIFARDAAGKSVRTEINGSGEIETTAYDNLDVRISGSGKVLYWGDPRITTNIDGSGEVKGH